MKPLEGALLGGTTLRAKQIGATLAALLIAAGVSAAQPACRSTVFVSVLDAVTNEPIDGLSASDFRAVSNGNALTIRFVTPPPTDRRFLFVVDRSGSMTAITDLLTSKQDEPRVLVPLVLKDALSAIRKDDLVAFRAFAGAYSHQTGFVGPDAALRELPDLLSWSPPAKGLPKGSTPLWNNMDAALRTLNPYRPGDIIVVISDGGDNASHLREGEIRSELLRAGVPVLAFVVARALLTPEEKEGLLSLFDLANDTGGAAIKNWPIGYSGDLGQTFQVWPNRLISQLAHQYGLVLDLPVTKKATKWRVELAPRNPSKKVKLLYPREISPCGSAP